MINNIPFMMREAKARLTRLGLALFYFYLLLVFLGIVGVIYGIISALQNIFLSATSATPWWEVIALILLGYAMVRIFSREAPRLLEADAPKSVEEVDQEGPPPFKPDPSSNVVPFERKQKW